MYAVIANLNCIFIEFCIVSHLLRFVIIDDRSNTGNRADVCWDIFGQCRQRLWMLDIVSASHLACLVVVVYWFQPSYSDCCCCSISLSLDARMMTQTMAWLCTAWRMSAWLYLQIINVWSKELFCYSRLVLHCLRMSSFESIPCPQPYSEAFPRPCPRPRVLPHPTHTRDNTS